MTYSSLIAFSLCLAPLALGCNEQELLDANRAQWLEEAPASYVFELENLGAGRVAPANAWIRVDQGYVVEVVELEAGLAPALDSYPTIDELFDFVQRQLDAGHEADQILYDFEYGHPVEAMFSAERGHGGFRVSRLAPAY